MYVTSRFGQKSFFVNRKKEDKCKNLHGTEDYLDLLKVYSFKTVSDCWEEKYSSKSRLYVTSQISSFKLKPGNNLLILGTELFQFD